MKAMKELIQSYDRVWFYLKDREAKVQFVQEATTMGCRYLNGEQLTVNNCCHIMALHADYKVAQVQIYIWNASFEGTVIKPGPLKVDYSKYIAGDTDWECTKSSFCTIQLPMSMSEN